MSPIPEGLDPAITSREIVFAADVTSVTPFLKLATVSRGESGHMTFAYDEGPNLGGRGSATWRKVLYGQKAMTMTVRVGLEFCRRQLSRYEIPEAVELRTEFPMSGAGKLLRCMLRHVALA